MPDPLGQFPDARDVAEQLRCSREECDSTAVCWTAGQCQRFHRPNPKGRPRIRDTRALVAKLFRDPECRSCGVAASDPHHIVLRSQGGDDLEDNILPLCKHCHMTFHFGTGEERERVVSEITFTEAEVAYVIRKEGDGPGREFLARVYSYEV